MDTAKKARNEMAAALEERVRERIEAKVEERRRVERERQERLASERVRAREELLAAYERDFSEEERVAIGASVRFGTDPSTYAYLAFPYRGEELALHLSSGRCEPWSLVYAGSGQYELRAKLSDAALFPSFLDTLALWSERLEIEEALRRTAPQSLKVAP